MSLVTTSVPNLINGVSQQADNLRFPSQCDEQINADSSITEGLTKRRPTNHVASLPLNSDSRFITHIDRDSAERFIVSIDGSGLPQVFKLDGTPVPVLNAQGQPVTAGDTAYLIAGDVEKDIKALTVADYTLILNRTKTVQLRDEVTPKRIPEALVFVKQLRRGADYRIKFYDDPAHTEPDHTVELLNVETNIDNAESTDPKVADQSDVVNLLGAALDSSSAGSAYHHTNSGAVMYVCKRATIDGSAALAFVQQDNPSFYAGVLSEAAATGRTPAEWLVDHVREEAPHGDQYCVMLFEKFGADADFRIEVECTIPEGMSAFKDAVQNYSLLPKLAWKNFTIRVVGDPETSGDEYYLRYDTAGTGFADGVWREAQKVGLKDQLDASTLPHALLNHGTHFEFKPLSWGTRKVGDADTNPPPSFVGKPIRNLYFWKNRFGLVSDENAALSEVGEFFNFFRTTVIQLLDSDPIDTGASPTRISLLNHAVPVAERLFLFSDKTQFTLQGGDLLTPKSVNVTQTTSYANSPDCTPLALGNEVYFAFSHGGFTGLSEYGLQSDTGLFAADDITDHCPRYLRGSARQIIGSDTENVLFVTTAALETGLYAYRFYRKNGERLLASWSTWTFGGKVHYAFLIESDLYVVIARGGKLALERIDLQAGSVDEHSTFMALLDRRVTDAQAAKSYDALADTTTFVLPHALNPDTAAVVKRATQDTEAGETVATTALDGNTITVRGDMRFVPLWFGERYVMSYDMSKPKLRERRGDGVFVVVPGRFQVSYGYLAFSNSLSFTVEVRLPGRAVSSKTYCPRFVAGLTAKAGASQTPNSGTFRFPVHSINDNAKVRIVNDTPLPCSLLSVDWESLYAMRAARV